MKKDIEEQLDAAFDAHATRVEQRHQAKEQKESKEDTFLRAFKELRTTLIKPALDSVAKYLQAKEMRTHIAETDEGVTPGVGRSEQTGITIYFLTDDLRLGDRQHSVADHRQPHLSFTCDKHAEVVQFFESTISGTSGGHSGGAGSAKLETLTEDLIHNKVLALVRQILR